MDKNQFAKLMQEKANKIQINLSNTQINQFYVYMNLLIEWNQKMNLTNITNEEEIINKHFIDSLTVLEYVTGSTVDIGTGAGFPGIPIKIVKKDIEMTLVDSLNKRIIFLEEVIKQLNLKGIKTLHARAEDFGREFEHREKYDTAMARAVAPLNILVEYMSPVVKVNGTCVCMKGPKLKEEIELSHNAFVNLGLELSKVAELSLPGTDIERNILVLKKNKKTAEKYPRKPNEIKQNPL